MSDIINFLVACDGHTGINYWHTDSMPEENFSLVMSDDGGYSSILMNEEVWDKMKKEVDRLIQEQKEYFAKKKSTTEK